MEGQGREPEPPVVRKPDPFFSRPDRVLTGRHPEATRADLYVCTVIFNPVRYRSRWKLYQDWAQMVKRSGAVLCVAEIAQRARDFVIGKNDPVHPDILLQLQSESEIWLKEFALNRLVAELPLDWQYVAWWDADISFVRDDIANETVQQLQHYKIVQCWSEGVDLGPNHETLQHHHSFLYSWQLQEPQQPTGYYVMPSGLNVVTWHPGFAWAMRREAWDALGGLLPIGIAGANDNHMAKALVGDSTNSVHPDIHENYRAAVQEWEDRATRYIQRNIGIVPGTILHYWHGPKANRRYWDRWKILVDTQYDPSADLKPDWQLLPQLVVENDRQIKLRNLMQQYFRQRNEDATDV